MIKNTVYQSLRNDFHRLSNLLIYPDVWRTQGVQINVITGFNVSRYLAIFKEKRIIYIKE